MSSIMKGIIDEAEAFDYDRLKAMPAKERIAYLRDKPELRNLYNAEFQKRIDAELNNYSWMTPEEKAEYERLVKNDVNNTGINDRTFAAEKYLKQLFQQKMDAKKAASMLKVHWAPLKDLQKYLTGQISTKTELSAYLAKSPEDLGKLRWGAGTIGIVIDGHITIGGRGDLGSDQYKKIDGVRGQQKYSSRPGQIDPTFDTLDLGKHHEVLVDNWKIREIVLPSDIPENVDAMIKKAGIPVRRLANQEQPVNEEELDENLRKWFKEKWVRFGPDGKIRGACARGSDKEGKPKCLPQSKAHSLGKKGRKYAAAKKRREDPNPERRGKAKNVATKKKTNEGVPFNQCPQCGGEIVHETMMNEKKDACYHKVRSRYKVWPSAYASGALVQCRKKGASNWGTGGKKNESSIMKGLVKEEIVFSIYIDNSPYTNYSNKIEAVRDLNFLQQKFPNRKIEIKQQDDDVNIVEPKKNIDQIPLTTQHSGNKQKIAYSMKHGGKVPKELTFSTEGVIIGHDATDPDVAVLGGGGTYKLSNLKKKALGEAKQLAQDIANGEYKNSAYNIKQLANTLNTIVAAEAEMEKLYFGETDEHDYSDYEERNMLDDLYDMDLPKPGDSVTIDGRHGIVKSEVNQDTYGGPAEFEVKYDDGTVRLHSVDTILNGDSSYDEDFIDEDYTGEFAAEKTPAINPYGGQKDRQFRGAISETPTDNPTGASGEGGWRKYKPKSAGVSESMYTTDIKQYASDLAKEMRREGYDWGPVDLVDTEEAIDDAREQLSMFASSTMCDAFGDYDAGEQLQIIKMFNKKFGGVREDTAYAGGGGQGGNAGESYRKFKPKSAGTFKEEQLDETGKVSRKVAIQDLQRRFAIAMANPKSTPEQLAQYQKKIDDMQALKGKWLEEEQLDEKCWDTHKQVGMKKKGDKMVPNCVPKESAIMKGLTGKRR